MQHNEAMQQRVRHMPKLYRPTYRTAMQGRSRRAAIRAFCLECCGWQRGEVRDGTDVGCPLHPYRPDYGESQSCDNRPMAHVESTISASADP